MKKYLSATAAFIILVTSLVPVSAAKLGAVIGKTVHTDIVASINNHNIATFNYNGYTMVVAEDLRNYGFDVVWDENARTLTVNRNTSVVNVASTYAASKIDAGLVGKKSNDVLYTDIRTFVNENEVESYNIGGNTIINIDVLSVYGEKIYNNYTRRVDINIYDGLEFKPIVYDDEYYYNRIISMKESYPEGMEWTNRNSYLFKGDHEVTTTGFGCAGFAFILSDAAFGDAPARYIMEDITMDKLRVGDILRINGNSHSVVVLEIHDDHIIIAEGNYNSSIHWGRRLSKKTVEAAQYIITRYQE